MTIPEVRARLIQLADSLLKGEVPYPKDLYDLSEALKRKKPVRKAKAQSRTMTETLASEIRAYSILHPSLTEAKIANKFNVNPGRVSEALRWII